MGENTSSNMIKTIVAGTSLEESHKKFTNHSSRKTTFSKLKKANIERSDIVKVTRHRSVQSLDDYDEADEEPAHRWQRPKKPNFRHHFQVFKLRISP